jgi:uncharacterized RDD family membrane protein YckC
LELFLKIYSSKGLVDVAFAFSITVVGSIVSFVVFPLSIVIVLPLSLVVSSLTLFFNDAVTYDEHYKVYRSIGKKMMGIVPLRYEESQPCSFIELFIHSLISSIITQVTFIPDILLLAFTPERRTCTDRLLNLYFAKENQN